MARLCKLCKLPPELREAVDEMLDQGLPQPAIQAWLEQHGVEVSIASISRHKRAHLGIFDFEVSGMPANDAPEPLSLTEYSRRMIGYLQACSLHQARYVQERQEAALLDCTEPDIDRAVGVLTRLVTLANMFMGFASSASLDAAIEVLRAAGYEIQGTTAAPLEASHTYREFKQWMASR